MLRFVKNIQVLYSKREKKKESALQLVKYLIYPALHAAFIGIRNRLSQFLFFIFSEFIEICLKIITESHMKIMKFGRKNARKIIS